MKNRFLSASLLFLTAYILYSALPAHAESAENESGPSEVEYSAAAGKNGYFDNSLDSTLWFSDAYALLLSAVNTQIQKGQAETIFGLGFKHSFSEYHTIGIKGYAGQGSFGLRSRAVEATYSYVVDSLFGENLDTTLNFELARKKYSENEVGPILQTEVGVGFDQELSEAFSISVDGTFTFSKDESPGATETITITRPVSSTSGSGGGGPGSGGGGGGGGGSGGGGPGSSGSSGDSSATQFTTEDIAVSEGQSTLPIDRSISVSASYKVSLTNTITASVTNLKSLGDPKSSWIEGLKWMHSFSPSFEAGLLSSVSSRTGSATQVIGGLVAAIHF